jgi:hypothetical protein
MLKIIKKHLPLTMMLLGTLLANLSTIVNADTLDRQVISAGGDHIVANNNAITYIIGQPDVGAVLLVFDCHPVDVPFFCICVFWCDF